MTAAAGARSPGTCLALPLLVAGPAGLAALLAVLGLFRLVPPGEWPAMLAAPDMTDPGQLLLIHAALPRLAVAVLAGGALGLAGVILQQVLRNPLAEPTTLGTSAGASLALAATAVYAPALLDVGREWVALAGAGAATLLVFGLAAGRTLSPVRMILAGLVVSLACGSASALLTVLSRDYLSALFVWQSGSLVQNGWATALGLAPRVAAGGFLAVLMLRPLTLLELDDEGSRSLGLPPAGIRIADMVVAVGLAAVVVAAVGVFGFVGLAGPALARLAGARSLGRRLAWAPAIGAALLWLTDELVQIAPLPEEMPAGTITALLGAPLLFVLLPRLRPTTIRPVEQPSTVRRPGHRAAWLLAVAGATVAAVVVALAAGPGADGWHFATGPDLAELLPLRAPRVTAALAAGVLLAIAGTLLQRLTGNPMAAPEVVGVSAGAMLGIIALMIGTASFDRPMLLAAGTAGALAALLVLAAVSRHSDQSGERLLLAGVALATAASALAAVVLAGGSPQFDSLVAWMAGSTYRATPADAAMAAAAAIAIAVLTPLTAHWLDVLPLGETTSRALGLPLAAGRLAILALAAAATAAATLVIGPLSFIGLTAPHIARLAGFRRALPQLAAGALVGGLLLVVADWLGRTLIFPWQIPAGLLATFVGAPYFLWLMRRRK